MRASRTLAWQQTHKHVHKITIPTKREILGQNLDKILRHTITQKADLS